MLRMPDRRLTSIRLVVFGLALTALLGNQASNAQMAEPEPTAEADTAPYIRSALPPRRPHAAPAGGGMRANAGACTATT